MGSSKSGSLDSLAKFSLPAAIGAGKIKLPETGIVGMLQARQEDKMNKGAQMAQQDDDQMAQYMQMMQQQGGMNMGGRVEMGLGGLLSKALKEIAEAASKNPDLGKIFGKSGGDLSIGDIQKIKPKGPKIPPRDRRIDGIDLFPDRARRTPETIKADEAQSNLLELLKDMGEFDYAGGGRVGLSEGGEPSMERVLELEEQGFSYEEAYEKAMQELLDYKGGFAAGGAVESMNFLKQHLPYQDGGHVALRRKMFKLGGPVNTHGVGITSGLEFRNNYNAGGSVRQNFGVGGTIAKIAKLLGGGAKKIPGVKTGIGATRNQFKAIYDAFGERGVKALSDYIKSPVRDAAKMESFRKLTGVPMSLADDALMKAPGYGRMAARTAGLTGTAATPFALASTPFGRMSEEERAEASDLARGFDTARGGVEFLSGFNPLVGLGELGSIAGDTLYEATQEDPNYLDTPSVPDAIRKYITGTQRGTSTPEEKGNAVVSKTKMSVDELAAVNKQENQERMQQAMEQYAELLAGSDDTNKLATLGDALIAGGSALMEGEGYGAAGRAFNEPLSGARRSKEERMSAANQAAAQLAISENMQIDAEQRGIVNEFLKTGSFSDAEANQLYSLAVEAGVQSLIPEEDGELDGDTLVNNPGVYADPKNLYGGGQVFVAVDSNGNVLPTNDPQEAKAHAAS